MITSAAQPLPRTGLTGRLHQARDLLGRFPVGLLQLMVRLGLAGVFWRSGQSKIASWDLTVLLFRDEYRVPLLPPETAAQMAAAVELSMPVLLALGLLTRLATLPLLGMTFVIQVFVYPLNWPEHTLWAAMLLFLLTRGAGPISLDRLIAPFLGFGKERGR